jgi:Fe-S-cluster containining protein
MTEQELQALYAAIPTERYCRGCHDCAIRCGGGAISLAETEWRAIACYIEEHLDVERLASLLAEAKTFEIADCVTDEFCILYDMQEKGCSIYPARPLVCRLLGHVEFMPCPTGRVPRVLPDGHRIMQRYAELRRLTFAEWFALAPTPRVEAALAYRKDGRPWPR